MKSLRHEVIYQIGFKEGIITAITKFNEILGTPQKIKDIETQIEGGDQITDDYKKYLDELNKLKNI